MPTYDQTLAECYVWAVLFADGTEIREWDTCQCVGVVARPEGYVHDWQCVLTAEQVRETRAMVIVLARPDQLEAAPLIPHYVAKRPDDGSWYPHFARRRTVDAPWNTYVRTPAETIAGSESWMGWQRPQLNDGTDGVYLRVMPDGTTELRTNRDKD